MLILAGAGSGKTRVIAHRIAYLVLAKDVPSDQILAVTFTNKAAAEMKARTETLLAQASLRTWISTFHSLCVHILRRHAAAAGLPPNFIIYDEDDQLAAVREALRTLDLNEKLHPPRRILSRVSAFKNSGRDPAEPAGDSIGASTFARIAERYRDTLVRAHALDFDDLLLRALQLLHGNTDVREALQRRFPYVLVDEYQDTNRTQYELIRHLGGPRANVTVVGDEDQSIYSWRGADIQNILDFESDFPGARVLRLEENYRSSQSILDTAGALVAHNQRRKGKTLRAVREVGPPVHLHQASDEFSEAAWVVERIMALRDGRCAVLFRMNAQSRLIEEALLRAGLPYAVVGGVGFYERREVKDVLSFLRLLVHPGDSIAFRRVVNVPPRGIGDRTLEELARIAREQKTTPWEAIDFAAQEGILPGRALLPLTRFRQIIEGLRQDRDRFSVKDLISRVLETTGYSAHLAAEDTYESQARLENLAELLSAGADYEQRNESPSLEGFLDQVSLLSDVDQARDDQPIMLMTLHAAKGLEFETVFLVGLEEGLLPHSRSLTEAADVEEERRLCYVGMTRAMERLHLSWGQSRQVFGQRRVSEASRFLDEIPRERLNVTGGVYVPERSRGGSTPRTQRAWSDREPRRTPAPSSSGDAMRPGMRVRHPLFGIGTIVRREGDGDDLKLTVSFAGVGAKRLVARYAGLEPVS